MSKYHPSITTTMTMPLMTLVAKSRTTITTLRSVRRSSSSSRPLKQSLLLQQQSHRRSSLSTTTTGLQHNDDDSTTLARYRKRRRRRPMMLLSAAAPRGSHHYAFGNTAGFLSPSPCSFPHHHHQQKHQTRSVSTWVPEFLQDVTIWGGSGWILQTLHTTCGLEYWSCFAAMSVIIRLGLSPFVLYGAHTASRFAKVVPEVQFLVSLFTNDMKRLRDNKRPVLEKAILMKTNMQTLSAIYKLHKIHPLSIFISPLLQMVFLSYISIDLRKIINGRDPLLAQELVDAGSTSTTTATAAATDAISTSWTIPSTPFPWLLPGDLTEPDPWFGLPVLAGVIMYANIEVAVGRQSLAGPATAKADTGVLLKDIFQSLAILMPCFTCQLPSGIQIYLVTSFVYSMAQSVILRNETFRAHVGLPAMTKSSTSTLQDQQDDRSLNQGGVGGKYASQFIRLKQLEQKAKEVRGKDGPLLGKYVLAHGWEISFPGEYRKSSIEVNTNTNNDEKGSSSLSSQPPLEPIAVHVFHAMATSRGQTLRQMMEQQQMGGAFVHGVTAPLWQLEQQQKEWLAQQPQQQSIDDQKQVVVVVDEDREVIPDVSDEVMEKANRGQLPVATTMIKPQSSKTAANLKGPIDLNAKKLQNNSGKKKTKTNRSGKKRR